ncbi:MAG: ABC transporter ATP-binding protein [Alphaproteobacteria bacterium]
MLDVRDLSSGYGTVRVLHDVTLGLSEGEVVALLGRNGAGKTTLLKTIMGLVPAAGGGIRLGGIELVGMPAHRIPRLGVGYVPQGRRLFGELTVAENLSIGCYARPADARTMEWILGLFPVLAERMNQRSGSLSGGEQQMLAVARALCLDPKLLLVDEPTEGLMPRSVATILETVASLRDKGVAVLLVEQKVEAALKVADRVAILENGRLEAVVAVDVVRRDPTLLRRHVGLGG